MEKRIETLTIKDWVPDIASLKSKIIKKTNKSWGALEISGQRYFEAIDNLDSALESDGTNHMTKNEAIHSACVRLWALAVLRLEIAKEVLQEATEKQQNLFFQAIIFDRNKHLGDLETWKNDTDEVRQKWKENPAILEPLLLCQPSTLINEAVKEIKDYLSLEKTA